MLENGCILYEDQYRFIYKVSYTSLFSTIYAIYRGYYDIALVPGGVFITSISYWHKPDYSWRRYVDMAYVNMAVIYQIYRAYNAENARLYYMVLFFAICFYEIGKYYYKRRMYWHSTYAYSMLHIMANVSNIVLYSGHIPQLKI